MRENFSTLQARRSEIKLNNHLLSQEEILDTFAHFFGQIEVSNTRERH